ncbi:uncharacterized protein HaLaN_06352, partial [Haematococcus lacustris]
MTVALANAMEFSRLHDAYEPATTSAWRAASRACWIALNNASDHFASFLKLGGPDALVALNHTLHKLQKEVSDLNNDKQLQRYRALQQDLKV